MKKTINLLIAISCVLSFNPIFSQTLTESNEGKVNQQKAVPDEAAIVIAYDDANVYLGVSGEKEPRFIFPNVVGRPKSKANPATPKDAYVGIEALEKASLLSLSNPVEQGVIMQWADFEKVLHHAFYNLLNIRPEEHPVIISEATLNAKPNREKITQILFETFRVPSMYMASGDLFALRATGKTTGIVVKFDDGITSCVAIQDDYVLPHTVKKIKLGGSNSVKYLMKLLTEKGYSFTTSKEEQTANEIYKKRSFVVLDFEKENEKSEMSTENNAVYELPNGEVIKLSTERYRSAEILFNPELVGIENNGVDKILYESITSCDEGDQANFYNNIVIAGSNSSLKGLRERLTKEISSLTSSTDIKIIAPAGRTTLSWIGASNFSQLETMQELWISVEDFEESGPSIINRR